LRSAFEIVQRAGSIQGVKTDIARQDARDAKITLMEAYIQRQSGCLASEELSRAYKLQPSEESIIAVIPSLSYVASRA
ncbi:hypothetical protein E4U28_002681, partial [Claviceps purpurea]